MKTICILNGGPMRKIKANGKIIEFEMHPYCGPTIIHKRTKEPLKNQPETFLRAASLWAQQGQEIKDGFCVYNSEHIA